MKDYLNGVKNLLVKSTLLTLLIFIIVIVSLLILGYMKWLAIVIASLIYSIITGYNSSLDCMQNAARQRPVVALHQGAGQILRFLMAVALVMLLGESSSVALSGYALAASIVLVSQYYFFHRKILPLMESSSSITNNLSRVWQEKMLKYAWPFATWGIFTWMQLSSDRWSLQTFRNVSDVGLYAVLYQIGYYPFLLFSGLLSQLATPIIFNKAGIGEDLDRLKKAYKICWILVIVNILFCIIATIAAYYFKDIIFSTLVAPQYRSVSPLLPLMTLAGGMFATGQVASAILTIDINTKILIRPKVITAILGILFNIGGAYYYGLSGVVFGMLLFSILYLSWIMTLSHSVHRKDLLSNGASVGVAESFLE
jgi:O-antigen/teichoic acid export membrane protein